MVEVGSWGTGLPFQGLEEAMKRKKEKSYCSSKKYFFFFFRNKHVPEATEMLGMH